MNKIGIFGASGMAREVGDIALELGYEPIYVVRDSDELDAWLLPEQVILERDVNQHIDMGYVIGIGNNVIRQRIAQLYNERLRFVSLIHPSASFGKTQRKLIESKRGVIVCAGVRFTNNIKVGDFCIFNLNSTISHDSVIDEFVYVAPGAHVTGNVHVGTRTWIGAGAIVNQGRYTHKLSIGEDTIIGSGSVVVKNCVSSAVYAGVPARRIK